MAGYSEKTLVSKLGYKPGDTVWVQNIPKDLGDYFANRAIEIVKALPATWAHAFFDSQQELADFCKNIALDRIEKGLWVSWPKKASGVKTDLSEQSFRDQILPLGWVDTKVAAIDNTWSGLLFYRRKNRSL